MFIKLAVSFLVVSLVADTYGSPFGQLFDAVKKPAEIAKDTIQQPFQPVLGAFGSALNRKSRAAQGDSSSGSPAGLFDFVKKPAEVVKDAFEKPLQLFESLGAPLNRKSRQADDDDDDSSSKKKDDKKKNNEDKNKNDQKDDDKKGDQQRFQPIFDLFGSHVDRLSGAVSAFLSPSGNKQ
ncbi:unnamed protein product [Chrysodeixis includens]|uniref:Uncharacterized protein n=1 Tax=Chrysodeixis includens TaxID=689277 RepID=A0A9P0BME0_CHRIL|nr:unnamed protein product [Chrysodeixis includens]